MFRNINWMSTTTIVLTAVCLIDLNVNQHRHPVRGIPLLKYNITGLAIIAFLVILRIAIAKNKKIR